MQKEIDYYGYYNMYNKLFACFKSFVRAHSNLASKLYFELYGFIEAGYSSGVLDRTEYNSYLKDLIYWDNLNKFSELDII